MKTGSTSLATADVFPELRGKELDDFLESLGDLSGFAELGSSDAPASMSLAPRGQEPYPFARLHEALSEWLRVHSSLQDGVYGATASRLGLTSLADVLTRPLIELLATARNTGRLEGEDGNARYHDFQEKIASDPSTLVTAYPQAWRFVRGRVDAAERFISEMAARIQQDWNDITTRFGIDADDEVSELAPSGDTHNEGRRVTVVGTRNGRKFVYKPRPVDGEAAYAVLTERLREEGFEYPAAGVIRREDYGYMEFLTPGEPRPIRQLSAETGSLAALLYLLNSRDIHFENVIVTNDGPVPIDLESILHPHRLGVSGASVRPSEAHQLLDSSVHGVGLLPLIVAKSGDAEGYYDVGFLGRGRVVGGGAFRRLHLYDAFTDEMNCAFVKPAAPEEPQQDVDLDELRDCAEDFVGAFANAYRALMPHRDLMESTICEQLTGARLRYLHNPTMLYTQVLHTLTSAPAGRSSELSVLLATRIGLNSTSMPALVASEAASLLTQDVPYFTVDPATPVVYAAQGQVVGELVAPPIELMRAKMARVGEDDLARQVRLVRSAFSATVPDESLGPVRETGADKPDSTTFADLAVKVGTDLASRLSLDRFNHLPATWIGPLAAIETDRPWPPGVLGYDLYTGRLGVGLAMARGARALGSPLFELVANQVFDKTASILSDETYDPDNMGAMGRGAYTGVAGVAWALWAAGRTLERNDWCDVATTKLTAMVEAAGPEPESKLLDVIAGAPGLFTVAQTIGSPIDLQPLRDSVTAAVVDGLEKYEVYSQSGFAHGLSGLLFHLSTSGPVPGAVTDTLMRRLGVFWRPEELNWSTNDTLNRATHGWCHGRAGVTIGVAASKVELAKYGLPELGTLVAAVGEDATGYNITHCHGDLGNHDMLRWLVTHETPEMGHVLEQVEDTLQASALARKLDDPHSRYSLNDGLMVGGAGVLLHAAERIDPSMSISLTTLEVR